MEALHARRGFFDRASALAAALCLALLLPAPSARSARVKDIAAVKGVRTNQLIGYGLVVGLAGTGDRITTEFTVQSLASVLGGMGIGVDPSAIQVRNVAAVMVTAALPPFARTGSRIDAVISSLGDSTSLSGGTLAMTPLYGADGEVYAIGQGPISVGGLSVSGGGGSSVQRNHPTVGRLVGGVTVERELAFGLEDKSAFELALHTADFTTAIRTAKSINQAFGSAVASATDPGSIQVRIPEAYEAGPVGFMAAIEAVDVTPDQRARVVVNERTGTVVMGESVSISTVAVSHGNLSVTIQAFNDVSQPAPFSDGETVEVTNDAVGFVEEEAQLGLIEGPVTIDELVRGLNSLGVSPRDLIAILQAIQTAGALSAELEVM